MNTQAQKYTTTYSGYTIVQLPSGFVQVVKGTSATTYASLNDAMRGIEALTK